MDLKNTLCPGLSAIRYKLTGKRIPVAVAWLITGRCNLDCCVCVGKVRLSKVYRFDLSVLKEMLGLWR